MKRLFCVLLALLMLCFTFVPTIAEDKQVNSKLSTEVKDTMMFILFLPLATLELTS